MSNTIFVNFSNNGTSVGNYVVENATLQAAFGGEVVGAENFAHNVSNGNIDVGNPVISADFTETGTLDESYRFGIEEWNAVKNISVSAFGTNSILFIADNFVHADMDFSNIQNTVELHVQNGKRSNILTGTGDDVIVLSTATNKASWSNQHNINTGDGDDSIVVTKGDITGGALLKFVDGKLTTVSADLGDGDDVYGVDDGVKTMDLVDGGAGSDTIFTGGGKDVIEGGDDNGVIVYDAEDDLYVILAEGDILEGGADADKFIYTDDDDFSNLGDGFDFIVDFEDHDILELNTQSGDVVTTETVNVVREGEADVYSGTMVFVNDDASVFLDGFTNTSEIFS